MRRCGIININYLYLLGGLGLIFGFLFDRPRQTARWARRSLGAAGFAFVLGAFGSTECFRGSDFRPLMLGSGGGALLVLFLSGQLDGDRREPSQPADARDPG